MAGRGGVAMSRVIKFRAWFRNEMIDNAIIFNESLYWNNEDSNGHHRLKYEKDYSIMQFTGLLDCNGAEIFEGDVVEFTDISYGVFITEVSWNSESAMFCCDTTVPPYNNKQIKMPNKAWDYKHDPCNCDGALYATKYRDLGSNLEKIKIIGNIHQQPELLK